MIIIISSIRNNTNDGPSSNTIIYGNCCKDRDTSRLRTEVKIVTGAITKVTMEAAKTEARTKATAVTTTTATATTATATTATATTATATTAATVRAEATAAAVPKVYSIAAVVTPVQHQQMLQ